MEWREASGPPAECVRVEVKFPDGVTISNVGRYGEMFGVLDPRGGDGGSARGGWRRHDMGWWLSPLPPPGEVIFSIEWPAAGLARIEAGVDAEPLLEAAKRVRLVSGLKC